ncbi:MAG: hypothetical protein ACLPWD_04925 [Methanobacterium sp.]
MEDISDCQIDAFQMSALMVLEYVTKKINGKSIQGYSLELQKLLFL